MVCSPLAVRACLAEKVALHAGQDGEQAIAFRIGHPVQRLADRDGADGENVAQQRVRAFGKTQQPYAAIGGMRITLDEAFIEASATGEPDWLAADRRVAKATRDLAVGAQRRDFPTVTDAASRATLAGSESRQAAAALGMHVCASLATGR